MRSDNLAPLLATSQAAGVGARKGVVVSWDQETAENVVLVGGQLFENLPVLNTSEAAILATGDVVTLMTLNGSWAILGRLTIPGTPEAVTGIQAITKRISAANDPAVGTRIASTYGDLTGADIGPFVTVTVGSSGRALAFWACDEGYTGAYQHAATANCSVEVSGATTRAASDSYALSMALGNPASGNTGFALSSLSLQAAAMHLFVGLNPGSTTFTMKYRNPGNDPANASEFSQRELAVFVL